MKKVFLFMFIGSMVFSLVLASGASADSTIGTNMSTTGTLKVTTGGATAVQFQNAAGTTLFIFDTTNTRFGINYGGAADTKFEVGGTASATNVITSGAAQFASNAASVAYSRFGSSTTNHANYISASNDLLVSGDTELRGSVSFGGVASISGIVYMNDGRFKTNADSTTAFRFQNAAGTTSVLTIDTTNTRVGVNKTPSTKFEVGGTASATYFMSNNAAQFASNAASVAYSRFGSSTTNHANYISASNDLLVSGDTELRGSVSFGGVASVSGLFFMNDGRHRPNANSVTAFRFQNTAGTTDVLTIDTTNTRVGVGNIGGTLDTLFEVGGTASISTLFATTKIVAGSGTASASAYTAEFVSTGTTSVLFGGSSTTLGSCLQLKNTTGQPVYARVVGTTWTVSAVSCR